MSDTYDAIEKIKISWRINDAVTSFNISFNTGMDPDEFDTGETFELPIMDTNQSGDEFVAIRGIIETVEPDYTDNNKIWGLTGRDTGRALIKQPFNLDSDSTTPVEYTVEELLDLILTDTNITVGRGQTNLSKVIKLTTDGTATNRFCGTWNTKQEAINQLFAQYIRFSGASQFKWFIDYSGSLRWFELNTNRGNKTYFFKDDDRLLSFKPKKDAGNILNVFKGYYGPEEDQTSVELTNSSCIAKYGRCVAEPYTNTEMTETEMTAHLQKQLDQKSVEIYTTTIVLAGFYHIEAGTQIEFPNITKWTTVTFTVVDGTFEDGSDMDPTTTINLSTDENAISLTNEFEAVQGIARKEVHDNKAETGVVTSVPTSGDRCDVWLRTAGGSGSGNVVSVRNVGGNFSTG